tara:strand:+ start:157 stop:324 length:168 start_codon:yes stop_codon:yes gene_type:complete
MRSSPSRCGVAWPSSKLRCGQLDDLSRISGQPDFDMSRFYAAPGDDEMIGDNLQA